MTKNPVVLSDGPSVGYVRFVSALSFAGRAISGAGLGAFAFSDAE